MKKAHGYIAVISAIIISSTLSMLVVLNSTSIFWTRLEQMYRENRSVNKNSARSCTYEALLQYDEDSNSIHTNERILTNSNSYCIIDSIATTSTSQNFTVHAYASGTYAGMIVETSKNLQTGILTITSWRDITSIPP